MTRFGITYTVVTEGDPDEQGTILAAISDLPGVLTVISQAPVELPTSGVYYCKCCCVEFPAAALLATGAHEDCGSDDVRLVGRR